MTDLEALFEQVRQNPSDEVLLGAYADCLEEEGRSERAQLVRQLAGLLTTERYRKLVPDTPHDHLLRDRIKWQLGLTKIEVGTRLFSWDGYGMCPTTFDGAIWVAAEPDEFGHVRMFYCESGHYKSAIVVKQVD